MQFLVNIWNAQRNAEQVEELAQYAGQLKAENKRLRASANQRGAGGKFTKKSPTE